MGFPTRTGRTAYGPDPENARPVRDPRKQLDAAIGRTMFWQLGGLGLTAPQAWFRATVSGTAITLGTHAEAFQPRGGAGPTLARTAAGVYTFAYTDTYADEAGEQRVLDLDGGVAVAMGSSLALGQVELSADAHTGTVRYWAVGGSAVDPALLFVVLW